MSHRRSTPLAAALALGALTTGSACPFLPDHDGVSGAAPDEFIALPRDFRGYQSWPSFTLDADEGKPGHATVDRTIYADVAVNDAGDAFAVGSIILKTGVQLEDGLQVHGMVKRGGSFNEAGAVGWEWFDFTALADGALVQKWRGTDPPDGECYGQLPGQPCDAEAASCNGCHASAAANDAVHSTQLQLGAIEAFLLRGP